MNATVQVECPSCGSLDVDEIKGRYPDYHCNTCGHEWE